MFSCNKAFAWYGGKTHIVGRLLRLMPADYDVFVEVFGGGAALLLHKPKKGIEVYNDINTELVEMFKCIKDKTTFKDFLIRAYLNLYSRSFYVEYKRIYKQVKDPVERASMFYFLSLVSPNHTGYGFARVKNQVNRNMPASVAKYRNMLNNLINMHNRLKDVIIENASFECIIEKYDSHKTFFYMDPPYLSDTRVKKNIYKYEMSLSQHKTLIEMLKSVKDKVMLSGYDNPLYNELNWNKVVIKHPKSATVINNNNSSRSVKFEVVWLNYDLFS